MEKEKERLDNLISYSQGHTRGILSVSIVNEIGVKETYSLIIENNTFSWKHTITTNVGTVSDTKFITYEQAVKLVHIMGHGTPLDKSLVNERGFFYHKLD